MRPSLPLCDEPPSPPKRQQKFVPFDVLLRTAVRASEGWGSSSSSISPCDWISSAAPPRLHTIYHYVAGNTASVAPPSPANAGLIQELCQPLRLQRPNRRLTTPTQLKTKISIQHTNNQQWTKCSEIKPWNYCFYLFTFPEYLISEFIRWSYSNSAVVDAVLVKAVEGKGWNWRPCLYFLVWNLSLLLV